MESLDYLPSLYPTLSLADITLKFTGKERNPESAPTLQPLDGLDNFGARYNSSQYGWFMSPDPLGNFVADPSNPQTWNMYAYTINNPLKYIDPTGTDFCDGGNGSDNDDNDEYACERDNGTWTLYDPNAPPIVVTAYGTALDSGEDSNNSNEPNGCQMSDPICQQEWEQLQGQLQPPQSPGSQSTATSR